MSAIPLSPAARSLLQRARSELAHGEFGAAAATLAPVLADAPDCAPALGLAGAAAQMQGQHVRAAELFRKAIKIQPQEARLHAGLGISLFETGDAEGAVAALQRACELAPGVAAGWYNLGKALKLQVHTAAAIAALRRALDLNPTLVPARLTLADALASIGQTGAAAAEFRRILQAHPDQSHAWFELSNLKVVPLTAADAVSLRNLFEQLARPWQDRVLYGFTLARALEDQGDYAGSFRVLKRANRLQREHIQWSAASHRAYVDSIQQAFDTRSGAVSAPAGNTAGGPVILLASLPRSGSSLVEQILASHPDVEGANEISDLEDVVEAESRRLHHPYPEWVAAAAPADWQRLGAGYLARTARWRARKPRFTDKNLANWQLVGPALAMLPAARVVIVRRDPLETCLACYRQWFSGGTAFGYDLDELAAYCADFRRLTRFWLDRYPGSVLDFEYESLLAEPESAIRRLLAFCNLSFDPACLAFHQTERVVVSAASAAQVRQPLRRDTARAARYGHLLDGLRQRLRDGGFELA